MLLQTNSYIVPKDKRAAHNHLMQRFRQVLMKIGCDHFEVYEQVGANWAGGDTSGRFVQMMRFRDRKHCQAVQLAERNDPAAQALVRDFCELINFPYQEQQGLFAHGYYQATIEPIKLHKSSELAYNAFPNAEIAPPPEPMPSGDRGVAAIDPPSTDDQGPLDSETIRKPAEGESDPAGDDLLALDDFLIDPDDGKADAVRADAADGIDEADEPDSERASKHTSS